MWDSDGIQTRLETIKFLPKGTKLLNHNTIVMVHTNIGMKPSFEMI